MKFRFRRRIFKVNKYTKKICCQVRPYWPDLRFIFWISLIYLFFKGPIEIFITEYFVRPGFFKIEIGNHTTLATFIFSFTLIVTAAWYRFGRKRKPWCRLTYFILFVFLIYLKFYRGQEVWQLYTISEIPKMFYTDVLFFGALLSRLIIHIPFKSINSAVKIHRPKFIEDNPLGITLKNNFCRPDEAFDDKLGYTKYARRIAKRMLSTTVHKSFAIGINGKWGSGKTTFMRIMQKALLKEKVILIEFNPWQSQNPETIIRDFFALFEEKIRPYHASLPRLMKRYAEKLSLNHKHFVTSIFDSIVTLVTRDLSLKSLYDEINNDIEKLEHKIVVFIDDLDRMESNEVLATIRLIRNTASFNKIYFVVAYDREYVINAIEVNNILNSESFLEKIFQLEINLPYYEYHRIHEILLNRFLESLPNSIHEKTKLLFESPSFGRRFNLNAWIHNIRDVIRLVNSISINIQDIENDVDIGDFLQIEILRLNHPVVYDLIKNSNWKYFKTRKNTNGSDYLYYSENEDFINRSRIVNQQTLNIHSISLEKELSNLKLTEQEKQSILKLITTLFNEMTTNLTANSISNKSKFSTYFRYGLGDNSLSQLDFERAFGLDVQHFTTSIRKWLTDGKEVALRDFLANHNEYQSRLEFEKIIKGILAFSTFEIDKEVDYWSFHYFPEDNLFNKLSDPHVLNVHFKNNLNEFKMFFNQVFNEKSVSPIIISKFLADFYKKVVKFSMTEFPLDKKELMNLIVNNFAQYSESLSSSNKALFRMFYLCRELIVQGIDNSVKTSDGEINQKAKIAMKKMALRDFKNFVELMISVNSRDDNSYALKNGIEAFGGFIDFGHIIEEKLIESPEDLFLNELQAFYSEMEKTNFEKYVEFQFEHIKPQWV